MPRWGSRCSPQPTHCRNLFPTKTARPVRRFYSTLGHRSPVISQGKRSASDSWVGIKRRAIAGGAYVRPQGGYGRKCATSPKALGTRDAPGLLRAAAPHRFCTTGSSTGSGRPHVDNRPHGYPPPRFPPPMPPEGAPIPSGGCPFKSRICSWRTSSRISRW